MPTVRVLDTAECDAKLVPAHLHLLWLQSWGQQLQWLLLQELARYVAGSTCCLLCKEAVAAQSKTQTDVGTHWDPQYLVHAVGTRALPGHRSSCLECHSNYA